MSSLVDKEEKQNEASKATRDDLAEPGNEEENCNWVEVRGGLGGSEHAGTKGLSVLPLRENSAADTARVQVAEPEVNLDDASALEKAEKNDTACWPRASLDWGQTQGSLVTCRLC